MNLSDSARLEFILELINDIHFIISRHEDVARSLNDIEGREAKMMRNIIAHDYLGIKNSIVQKTLEINIPELEAKIRTIMRGIT